VISLEDALLGTIGETLHAVVLKHPENPRNQQEDISSLIEEWHHF